MTKDEYAKAIEAALVSIVKQIVMRFMIEKLPFLAGSFFNPILGFFAGMFAEYAGKQAEIGAFIAYSDFRVDEQGRDFISAANKLTNAKTPEEKLAAEKEFIRSADKFISLRS